MEAMEDILGQVVELEATPVTVALALLHIWLVTAGLAVAVVAEALAA
jgi:hypothetical protein